MSEDERTLWCGNLSEKVTDELLYELFLQAGPIENVTIPRDSDKRQRSYAFITYVHACSVEYAMLIFEGSALFKRTLTLHRKNRNGPNPAASPKENFKYPSANGRFHNEPMVHMQHAQDNNAAMYNGTVGRMQDPTDHSPFMSSRLSGSNGNDPTNNAAMRSDILSAMGSSGSMSEMLLLLGQQMLVAELPAYEGNSNQTSTYRAKMNHSGRHNRNPYSRSDRSDRNHDRNSGGSNSRQRYRNEHDDRWDDRDREHRRRR